MTLKEAIEIGDRYYNLNHNVPLADLNEAARLLIEAGKRIKEQSNNPKFGRYKPLPGETED